jgi:hypothetical protein
MTAETILYLNKMTAETLSYLNKMTAETLSYLNKMTAETLSYLNRMTAETLSYLSKMTAESILYWNKRHSGLLELCASKSKSLSLRRTVLFVASLALAIVCCANAAADDRYDDLPVSERFKLRIGGYLIDRFDTTARFDSNRFPIGTLIDLEENFNVDDRDSVLRIDGFYRFNKRHRLDWTYYSSRRGGASIASQEFIVGDPDDPEGGFIIPKDARVQTQWNFDLLKLGYAWSFLNKRRYEMFIGTGLNIRNLDIEIDYQANVGAITESDRFDGEGFIPLPTAVIGGRWNLTEKWQSLFRYEIFLLEVNDFRGSQQDFQLLLEHNTFNHVGFGFGINTVDANIRASNEQLRGELDSRTLGILGYIKFYR